MQKGALDDQGPMGTLCDHCEKLRLDYAKQDHRKVKILTEYHLEDSIPGLPYLRNSSRNGCDRLLLFQIERLQGEKISELESN